MALKWIIGTSLTGAISEANTLPVIAVGDNVNLDVNAGDTTTITVSRADLPSDWRTYLKPFDKFVALVDPDVTFASGVVASGLINKIDGRVKGVIKIQVALGLREYLAARIISGVYNTTDANPNSGITFNSNGPQGVMAGIITHCFSTTGIPGGAPKPPALLGTVTGGVPAGTTYSFAVKNSDGISYADALDEIRDTWVGGREYRFVPRWFSSAKDRIVFDAVLGSSAETHIGENTTRAISLADNAWKPLSFGQTASSDNLVTRIIGHSTYGDDTTGTGSDYTSKTSTTATSILIDQFFNPGTELTAAEMSAQLTARLAYNSTMVSEVTFERSYDTLTELRTMISYLGNMVTFTGTEQAAQFGATMRIVGLSFSPERRWIRVDLMPKAATYPALPKDRKSNLGSDGGFGNTGGGTPVTPPPFKPPVIPPFTLPGDTHTEPESILEPVDMRHFAPWTSFGDPLSKVVLAANWHKQPDLTRSRINYETGEMIGLSTASRMLYGFNDNAFTRINGEFYQDRISTGTPKATTGITHNKDLDIYSVNIVGMFDRDSNPYMLMSSSTAPNADSFKKLVGTIAYSLYSELEVDPVVFRNSIPTSNYSSTRVMSIADYNLFCSQDLQTVYVQVMVTTSLSQIDSAAVAAGYKSYSTTLSKVFKGVRDGTGAITTWEDLGEILTIDKNTDNESVFFSTAIYEIEGQLHAFGGYLIPLVEDQVLAPTLNPAYELKFYQHGHQIVNPTNFIYGLSEVDLPGLTMLETGSTNEEFELKAKFPYAINVDYSQKRISLGISRGADGKLSQYFSSSFSNLLNFTKILSTDRETAILRGDTLTSISTVEEPFRFRSKAPIFYKNNFFLFGGTSTADANRAVQAAGYTNKQIVHIRGKVGFEDTVAGALKFTNSQGAASPTSTAAKDAYVIYNSTASNANDLGAFGNYAYRNVSTVRETRNVYGMEYFIYQGFLYMICDTTLMQYENSRDTDSGGYGPQPEFRYWVGKFRIKDEIL